MTYHYSWATYLRTKGKPKHIRVVWREMQNKYNKYFGGNVDDCNAIINWLNDTFTQEQLNEMHTYVSSQYGPGGKFSTRGRPPGSRNKSTRAIAAGVHNYEPATPAYNPPAPANGHAPAIDMDALSASFVSKAVFDNHDDKQAADIATLQREIAVAHGAAKLAFDKINSIQENKPTIIHIKPIDAPVINLDVQHCNFPDLVTALRARQFNNLPLNAWLYGPAGTGKSKACEAAIKAFGRTFYGNGKTLDKIEVMGYMDGYGKYQRTAFREAYEHGHGYCADEIDSWSPEATTALQGALAGDWAAFADGMVKRHPNFIFIAAGNTTGKGATIEYIGRMQQDAAFLDRFVFVDWPHDNGLEDAIVSNKEWLTYVRHVRNKLAANNDIRNHLVTMRAAIHGEALLAAGMAWDKVVNMTLRKGLPQNTWDKIK